VYFPDVIVSKMRVKSRLMDMSEWVSTIRRACHALVCTSSKGTDMFFFVRVTTPHGHHKPCPPDKVQKSEQMSETNIRLMNSDTGPEATISHQKLHQYKRQAIGVYQSLLFFLLQLIPTSGDIPTEILTIFHRCHSS